MTKTQPKGVRFTDEQHEALQAAAKADMRPVSSLIQKIVATWLQEHGWLPTKGDTK